MSASTPGHYIRCNYRITGSRLDTEVFAGSYWVRGQLTTSMTTGSYYTDIAALLGFTGSVLWVRGYPAWGSQGTGGSAPILITVRKSTGTATCLAVFAARLPVCSISAADVSGYVFGTTSVDTGVVLTYVVNWDALVVSHY